MVNNISDSQTKSYSIYFDNKSDLETSNKIRRAWLDKIKNDTKYKEFKQSYQEKDRTFLECQLKQGNLQITHHEWGIEYIFTFLINIASGLVAAAICYILKEHIKKYFQTIKECYPENYVDIHVFIGLERPIGILLIAKIEKGKIIFIMTVEELEQHLKDN